MTTSVDQGLLNLVDLRLRVRANAPGHADVDPCLTLLRTAMSSDPQAIRRLEAKAEELRARLGERKPPKVN